MGRRQSSLIVAVLVSLSVAGISVRASRRRNAAGYGEAGPSEREVTPQTSFIIGSITKASPGCLQHRFCGCPHTEVVGHGCSCFCEGCRQNDNYRAGVQTNVTRLKNFEKSRP
jgi:hypothetical protein